jgi:protein-S-isoprenylcysteine O-methyltransferase Ste14
MTVRSALLAGYAILLPIALFYRIRSGASGEKLDRRREGAFILATLRPLAGLCALGWIAWLWRPSSMDWAAIPLPPEARAIGFACWLVSAVLWIWTFVFLGKNLTDTVVTRKAHTLVTSGPYRFVRHPFYVAVALHLAGAALISSNAFILATGIATVALIVLRTQRRRRSCARGSGSRIESSWRERECSSRGVPERGSRWGLRSSPSRRTRERRSSASSAWTTPAT